MGRIRATVGPILAMCSLFCALDAWVLDLVPYASVIGLPLSIVGLCLSVSGGRALRAGGYSAGTATTGMVLGIIGVVLTGITFLSCGICDLMGSTAEEVLESMLGPY